MSLLKRAGMGVLVVATLVSAAPFALVVAAGTTATLAGCALDEGSVHPCLIAGVDYGDALYFGGVSGWFMLLTWPVLLTCLLAWAVLGARALWRRPRR